MNVSHANKVDARIIEREKVLSATRRSRLDQILNDATSACFNDLLGLARKQCDRPLEDSSLADLVTFDRTNV